jgi:hypothetical protein
VFSFHLAEVGPLGGARALSRGLGEVPGLKHSEVLAQMRLGAPVVSPDRVQVRRLAVFARWTDDSALDDFLGCDGIADNLARGWHVRLEFVRRWGSVQGLDDLPEHLGRMDLDEPAVAVTLARHRLTQLPRFIRWGRPVERQVRDDPQATLALAAMRPPRTFSTFTVWRSSRAMTDMVFGRARAGESREEQVRRHVEAMAERERHEFHDEFTTLRFRPVSEHGSWQGRSDYTTG